MPLEAVVRQNATQVGIIGEIDPEQIPGFTLPPARTAEKSDRGRHRLLPVGVELQTNTLVQSDTEEVVYDLEAHWPIGIVDTANVAEHGKAAPRVIAQKSHNAGQPLTLDPTAQLAPTDLSCNQRTGERRRQILHEGLELFVHRLCYRAKFRVRLIFFCCNRTPYSIASAVGGHPGT